MSNNIKKLPTFRGRFGVRSVRRKSIAKWNRWRHPRGIDITWRRGDGYRPKIGYGGNRKTRDLHPSRRVEVYVRNLQELEKHIRENKNVNRFVYRLASNIGMKKRIQIKQFAEKHKLKIANLGEVKEKEQKKEKGKKEKRKGSI